MTNIICLLVDFWRFWFSRRNNDRGVLPQPRLTWFVTKNKIWIWPWNLNFQFMKFSINQFSFSIWWNTVILNSVELSQFSILLEHSINFQNLELLSTKITNLNLNLEEGQPKQFGTPIQNQINLNLNLNLKEGQPKQWSTWISNQINLRGWP